MSFSHSRTNRDRREQSFARAVIAQAERLRREAEQAEARELAEPERCYLCGAALRLDDPHDPYCSSRCAVEAELDV